MNGIQLKIFFFIFIVKWTDISSAYIHYETLSDIPEGK